MLLRKAYLEIPLHKIYFTTGDACAAVTSLQLRLAELGFPFQHATGVYDENTKESVRIFQQTHGLFPDGATDWKTYLFLWRDKGREVLPVQRVEALSAASAAIHISRKTRTLSLYIGETLHRQYPIAVGKSATPTPVGNFAVVTKVRNPGGILGTRWMGLNYDSYGIHGTNRPWSIGQAVSLGCIRMHNSGAEEVFSQIRIGTPVHIRE